ncbi:methionine adenosyltransferase [Streptomyces sp. NPDC056486]|uniref:methionine adenosyltransferase n=1 Tax=Streptomyces sp. NPDC056486 TaxID=3345835 RepID=UPI0036926D3C
MQPELQPRIRAFCLVTSSVGHCWVDQCPFVEGGCSGSVVCRAKLALLGGSSEVRYGTGEMTSPVRVLVNGRAAPMCGGERIPVTEIVEAKVRAFFAERLAEVADHLDVVFNITSNSSPGAVLTGDGVPDRTRWFNPRSVEDLRERRVRLSNDTSLGTGWAPESPFESFVRELVDHFSGNSDFTSTNPWCGSDVKLMGYWDGDQADVVLCVPQKSRHVGSRAEYVRRQAVGPLVSYPTPRHALQTISCRESPCASCTGLSPATACSPQWRWLGCLR